MEKDIRSLIMGLLIAMGNEVEQENENVSMVGKRIIVKDNSYIKRVGVRQDNHIDLLGKEFVIVSEPYMKQVHEGVDFRIYGAKYVQMVKVFSLVTTQEYEVMFHEGWLLD